MNSSRFRGTAPTSRGALRVPGVSGALGVVIVLAALAALGGCSDSDTLSDPGPADGSGIELELSGMPLGAHSEGVFELWIAFALTAPGSRHSAAASAGRFKIHDQTGEIVGMDYQPMAFAVDPADETVPVGDDGSVLWQLAVDAFITLELREDPDPDPRPGGLIAGSFLNGVATLSIDSEDGLDTDFSTASGSAQMATPTNADSQDEDQGIWFALPGGAGPSLTLPTLPAGWTYEGWVLLPQLNPRSLGKFDSVSAPDSDGAGPLATTQPWDFPGSDFPFGQMGPSLADGAVVITIEPPFDEDGDGPFFLEVLGGGVPSSQAVNEMFPLANVASFPTGTVTIPAGS